MALLCLLLPLLPIDLQQNGVARWRQLSFSRAFSSSPAQRSGKVHPLGLPWAGWEDQSTVKPQISSEESWKGQELGYCVAVGSVKHVSWDMFVWLGFFTSFFLNFDKAFALTAVLGHQPAHTSKQE